MVLSDYTFNKKLKNAHFSGKLLLFLLLEVYVRLNHGFHLKEENISWSVSDVKNDTSYV